MRVMTRRPVSELGGSSSFSSLRNSHAPVSCGYNILCVIIFMKCYVTRTFQRRMLSRPSLQGTMRTYWSLHVAFLALAAVAKQVHCEVSTCPADSDCADCSRESGADCQPEVSASLKLTLIIPVRRLRSTRVSV